jgi:hypothetical protein
MIRDESTEDPEGFGRVGEASRMWIGAWLRMWDREDGSVAVGSDGKGGDLCRWRSEMAVERPKTPAPTISMGSNGVRGWLGEEEAEENCLSPMC